MHELSIAQELLRVATAEARRVAGRRVTRLVCRIGELRQLDDRLMAEAFELVARDTLCERAKLEIEKVPLLAVCPHCGRRFAVRRWDWRCPGCGRDGSVVGGGQELELRCVEVEVEDENPGGAADSAAQRASGTSEP